MTCPCPCGLPNTREEAVELGVDMPGHVHDTPPSTHSSHGHGAGWVMGARCAQAFHRTMRGTLAARENRGAAKGAW